MHGEEERCMACEADFDALWTVRHFSGAFGHVHKKLILISGPAFFMMGALIFALGGLTPNDVVHGGIFLIVGGVSMMDSIVRRLVVPRQRRRFSCELVSRSNISGSGAPAKRIADVLRGETCSQCDIPSSGSCSRCAVPFCRDHRKSECLECKTAWFEHWSTSGGRRRSIRLYLVSLGVCLLLLGFAFVSPSLGLSLSFAGKTALVLIGVILMAIGDMASNFFQRRARKAFMRTHGSN